MSKFREGSIVYHKASHKRGVISEKATVLEGEPWVIKWEDGTTDYHNDTELYTEIEFKKLK